MLIYIPTLSSRQSATAYATFEVRTATVLPPTQTGALVAPPKPDRTIKRYLGPSPFIDVNHRKIRAAIREATAELAAPSAGATGVWERVEALYDYALEHVKYKEGDDKSSVQALADGEGDCQALGAVFVAMCRTEKIPARMVWADGHQYAEFYLEDETGAGGWYPIETAGSRAFGEMPLARVILQKGDNFRVPERPRERLRYASDYTMFLSAPSRQPKVVYVREMVE
jgi:transglutaminase-like putative cysteine protease